MVKPLYSLTLALLFSRRFNCPICLTDWNNCRSTFASFFRLLTPFVHFSRSASYLGLFNDFIGHPLSKLRVMGKKRILFECHFSPRRNRFFAFPSRSRIQRLTTMCVCVAWRKEWKKKEDPLMWKRGTAKTNDRKFKTEREPATQPKYTRRCEKKSAWIPNSCCYFVACAAAVVVVAVVGVVSVGSLNAHTAMCVAKRRKRLYTLQPIYKNCMQEQHTEYHRKKGEQDRERERESARVSERVS